MHVKYPTFITFLFLTCNVIAQEMHQPPIPVEIVIGNNRYGIQTTVNRKLPNSKFLSFLSIGNIESTYENSLESLDYVSNSQISYNFFKGLGVSAGLNLNNVTGLAPTAGLQYVFVHPQILFVLAPSYVFRASGGGSAISILEFRPSINNQLKLYTRLQGLYAQNLKDNFHERSFVLLRIGLEKSRYQFGLGCNFDQYGPMKKSGRNYALFLRSLL